MDFAGLKDAVNRWSERSFSDDQLNEFVVLAEANIRRRLTGYQREITTTLVADTDGQAALPSDFLGFSSLSFNGLAFPFSVSGSTVSIIRGAGRTFDIVYYGKLPALSGSNATNWLLDTAPDVYLWLVKAQAREYNEEWDLATGLEAKGLAALQDLNLQNTVIQYGRAGMRLPVQAI